MSQPCVVLVFKDNVQGNSRCFQILGLECLSCVPPGRALDIQGFFPNHCIFPAKITWSWNSGGNWDAQQTDESLDEYWVASQKLLANVCLLENYFLICPGFEFTRAVWAVRLSAYTQHNHISGFVCWWVFFRLFGFFSVLFCITCHEQVCKVKPSKVMKWQNYSYYAIQVSCQLLSYVWR